MAALLPRHPVVDGAFGRVAMDALPVGVIDHILDEDGEDAHPVDIHCPTKLQTRLVIYTDMAGRSSLMPCIKTRAYWDFTTHHRKVVFVRFSLPASDTTKWVSENPERVKYLGVQLNRCARKPEICVHARWASDRLWVKERHHIGMRIGQSMRRCMCGHCCDVRRCQRRRDAFTCPESWVYDTRFDDSHNNILTATRNYQVGFLMRRYFAMDVQRMMHAKRLPKTVMLHVAMYLFQSNEIKVVFNYRVYAGAHPRMFVDLRNYERMIFEQEHGPCEDPCEPDDSDDSDCN